MDADGNEKMLSFFRTEFPDASIYSSYFAVGASERRLSTDVPIVSAIFGVSVISFVFLLMYVMKRAKRELIVYNIVGASRRTVRGILISEMFLFTALVAGAAILIHRVLYDAVFTSLNVVSPLYYTAGDYALLFLIDLVLTAAVYTPYLMQLGKTSFVVEKREEGIA